MRAASAGTIDSPRDASVAPPGRLCGRLDVGPTPAGPRRLEAPSASPPPGPAAAATNLAARPGRPRPEIQPHEHPRAQAEPLPCISARIWSVPFENGRTGDESGGSARPAAVEVRGVQKANAADGCPDQRIVQVGSNDEVAAALAAGEASLAAGTAWLWAHAVMADAVDVLVID